MYGTLGRSQWQDTQEVPVYGKLGRSQCMGHAQKGITGTQTFLISKLGGWKYSTQFQKSSAATYTSNRHQALKYDLDNTDVMEIGR